MSSAVSTQSSRSYRNRTRLCSSSTLVTVCSGRTNKIGAGNGGLAGSCVFVSVFIRLGSLAVPDLLRWAVWRASTGPPSPRQYRNTSGDRSFHRSGRARHNAPCRGVWSGVSSFQRGRSSSALAGAGSLAKAPSSCAQCGRIATAARTGLPVGLECLLRLGDSRLRYALSGHPSIVSQTTMPRHVPALCLSTSVRRRDIGKCMGDAPPLCPIPSPGLAARRPCGAVRHHTRQ